MNRYINADERFATFLTKTPLCPICGQKKVDNELDHKYIPHSKGGPNCAWNLQWLCRDCNIKKGDTVADYIINKESNYAHQNAILLALELYPFDQRLPECVYRIPEDGTKYDQRNAALVFAGTGSGKTRVIQQFAYEKANQGKKVLIVGHAEAILQNFEKEYATLLEEGVFQDGAKKLPKEINLLYGGNSNLSAAGLNFEFNLQPVVYMGIQYCINRIQSKKFQHIFHQFDYVLIDEGHHVAAETWMQIINGCPDARIIYFTGTPVRYDKLLLPNVPYYRKELDEVYEYTVADLAEVTGIKNARFTRKHADALGIIKEAKPLLLDKEDIYVAGNGPFANLKAALYWTKKQEDKLLMVYEDYALSVECFKDFRNALEKQRKEFPNWPKFSALVKCHRREHVEMAVKAAQEAGWNAAPYYDDSSRKDEMERNLKFFQEEDGPINMLINMRKITEGYSCPYITMTIFWDNVNSEPEAEQHSGRGGRMVKGISREDTPYQIVAGLNFASIPRMIEKFCNLETSISFTVPLAEGEGEPPTRERRDIIYSDSFGDTIWVWGEELRDEDDFDCPDELRAFLEEKGMFNEWKQRNLQTLKETDLSPVPSPNGHRRIPDNFDIKMGKNFRKSLLRPIASNLYCFQYNYQTPEELFGQKEAQKIVWMSLNMALNKTFPDCKGWFSGNELLDPHKVWYAFEEIRLNPQKIETLAVNILERKMIAEARNNS